MCGRIDVRANPFDFTQGLLLSADPIWPRPRYNISLGQQILAVRQHADGTRTADPMRWGFLTPWATTTDDAYTIARSETVGTSRSFGQAIRQRRCIIPVTGFYEWQVRAGQAKQPWHISGADALILPLAGIWQTWRAPGDKLIDTCAILTTEPNTAMARIHNRMPVMLSYGTMLAWLSPDATSPELLQRHYTPCPPGWLVADRVSTLVDNARNDSPECIVPLPPIIPEWCEFKNCRRRPTCRGLVFGSESYVCDVHRSHNDFTLVERLKRLPE